MTTSDPDDNTSVPSRPVEATPEQLREQLLAIRTPVKWHYGEVTEYDSIRNDDIIDAVLALFATFLASIELPEKQRSPRKDHSPDDFASGYCMGHDTALSECQAIIDKIVEALK